MSQLRTRYVQLSDAEHVILLANNVQAALTNSGSLQEIGPLTSAGIEQASVRRHGLLIERPQARRDIIGCAFATPLSNAADVLFELGDRGLATVSRLPLPWLYLHSVMLRPDSQGHGIGAHLIEDFIRALGQENARDGGTVVLDCWAGNDKLREFYAKVGFTFLAVVPKHDYEIAIFYRQLPEGG